MVVFAAACLLVGLAVSGTEAFSNRSCPAQSDIFPCLCYDDSPRFIMDCSGVKDEPELAKVFTADFPSLDFDELGIRHDPMNIHHRLHSIEPSTLGKATFQFVNISGTQIIKIDGKSFQSSKSTLQHLALGSNRIYEFPFASFSSYTSLTTVILYNNNLPQLQLIFSPFWEILDVSQNMHMVVEGQAFENTPSLVKINMSHTGQQSIELGLFANMDQLQQVDLSNNELKELQESAIVTAKSSLTYLDLSNNEISRVTHDSIVGLAVNATLRMANNNITFLTQESWQPIFDQLQRPGGTIDLSGNPLNCGCEMAWIVLNEDYLNLLTDKTTCANGSMVIFLDPNLFILMC